MLERLNRVRNAVEARLADSGPSLPRPTPLRTAAAQLLVATSAAAALTRFAGGSSESRRAMPVTWAPLAVGVVAAAAHLRHLREPSPESASATRLLDGASIAVGATLVAFDLLRSDHRGPGSLAALAFASAGVLGIVIDRHETQLELAEHELRRRADLVERLVPRRKARLDRIVVHV
jgi:hypothetical protein